MNERIEKLKAYLAESPGDAFLRHALALEYVKMGDDLAASFYFQQNLQDQPGYVATYYHLGKAYERTGARDKAIDTYNEGMLQAKKAGDMHTYNEIQGALEDLIY